MTKNINVTQNVSQNPLGPDRELFTPPKTPFRRINFLVEEPAYQKFATAVESQGRSISGVLRQMMLDYNRHRQGKEVVHIDGGRCPFDYVNALRRD